MKKSLLVIILSGAFIISNAQVVETIDTMYSDNSTVKIIKKIVIGKDGKRTEVEVLDGLQQDEPSEKKIVKKVMIDKDGKNTDVEVFEVISEPRVAQPSKIGRRHEFNLDTRSFIFPNGLFGILPNFSNQPITFNAMYRNLGKKSDFRFGFCVQQYALESNSLPPVGVGNVSLVEYTYQNNGLLEFRLGISRNYKVSKKLKFYVGSDLKGIFSQYHSTTRERIISVDATRETIRNDVSKTFGIAPFVGLSRQFSKRLSVSLEFNLDILLTLSNYESKYIANNFAGSTYYRKYTSEQVTRIVDISHPTPIYLGFRF